MYSFSIEVIVTKVENILREKMRNGNFSARLDITLNIPLPIDIITMNVANTNPYGTFLFEISSVGVHKKTNVYIAPKNRDCESPNTHMFLSIFMEPLSFDCVISGESFSHVFRHKYIPIMSGFSAIKNGAIYQKSPADICATIPATIAENELHKVDFEKVSSNNSREY